MIRPSSFVLSRSCCRDSRRQAHSDRERHPVLNSLFAGTGNELQSVVGVQRETLLLFQPCTAIRVVYLSLFQHVDEIGFGRG